MKNSIKLQHIWQSKQKKLPGTNCIVYADGSVVILNFTFYTDTATQKDTAVVSPLCETTIDSLLKYKDWDSWVWVDAWNQANLIHGDKRYIGGEGAYGNEGFVACEDKAGKLIWAMFFQHTNPIKELKIEDNCLIGITEHSESQIEINLNELTDIRYTIYASRC